MRSGESKYKGKIMERISEERWKLSTNYLPQHVIAKVLDEAKQDFIFKMKGLDTDNPQYNEIETFLKIRSDIFVWEWFERWFGDVEK